MKARLKADEVEDVTISIKEKLKELRSDKFPSTRKDWGPDHHKLKDWILAILIDHVEEEVYWLMDNERLEITG